MELIHKTLDDVTKRVKANDTDDAIKILQDHMNTEKELYTDIHSLGENLVRLHNNLGYLIRSHIPKGDVDATTKEIQKAKASVNTSRELILKMAKLINREK